jgi:hypothetical protein
MPAVERIQIPVTRPQRFDQGRLNSRILEIAAGMYATTEIQARQLRVLKRKYAAAPRENNDTRPDTQPRSVVCSVVKPNDLMINEYWFVMPLAISCDHACRKKSQVFGSRSASMNLLGFGECKYPGDRSCSGVESERYTY